MAFIDRIIRRFVLRPKTLFSADSPLGGRVVVSRSGRERLLEIGGQVHSVYRTDGDWDAADRDYWGLLARPPYPLPPSPRVFMIGLGGGTALRLIDRLHRPASVVVAEADPVIVSVAARYFGLGDLPGVDVMTLDGLDAVRRLREARRSFDLLIDDAYFDARNASEEPGASLIAGLASIARPGAVIVLNRPVDRPEDEAANTSFAAQLRRMAGAVEVRSVRGEGNNDVIYFRAQRG